MTYNDTGTIPKDFSNKSVFITVPKKARSNWLETPSDSKSDEPHH